jgi:hypothetical protein
MQYYEFLGNGWPITSGSGWTVQKPDQGQGGTFEDAMYRGSGGTQSR